MKILWNRKYNTIAVYACVTAFVIITAICLFVNFGAVRAALDRAVSILAPVLWGFAFAYLLSPAYKYFRDRALRFIGDTERRRRTRKALALIATYLSALLLVSLFILVIVPQIAGSYTELQARVGGYFVSLQEWLERRAAESELFADFYARLLEYVDVSKLSERLQELVRDSFDIVVSGTSYVFGLLGSVVTQIKNITLGFIISVYMLIWKEKLTAQAKKLLFALLDRKAVDRLLELLRMTDRTFGGFIVGKLIDSLIIGMLTFIVLGIFDMPYYPLVSVIVGVTNVIPFFGPFIGAIPSAFIIFVADPIKALWFVLIIFIIQQIDGNIIGPRILGDTTGLSALWVIVAIIVMSGLFGVLGMFIGVPVFAVLYTLVKQSTETRLRRRGMPVSTDAYYPGEPEDTRPVKITRRTAYGGTAGADPDRLAPDDAVDPQAQSASADATGDAAGSPKAQNSPNETAGVNEKAPQTQGSLGDTAKDTAKSQAQSAPTDAGANKYNSGKQSRPGKFGSKRRDTHGKKAQPGSGDNRNGPHEAGEAESGGTEGGGGDEV